MMTLIVVFILSFISFMHFSVSSEAHYRKLYGTKQIPKAEFYLYQSMAWVTLLVSLPFPILTWGVGIGIMAWLLMITLGSLMVVLLVNFLPRLYSTVWTYLGVTRKLVITKAL